MKRLGREGDGGQSEGHRGRVNDQPYASALDVHCYHI